MQVISLIGAFFIGEKAGLSTTGLLPVIKTITELHPGAQFLTTLDGHTGIVITKCLRILGIDYGIVEPATLREIGKSPTSYLRLLTSLRQDAAGIIKVPKIFYETRPTSIYHARNHYMIEVADETYYFAPPRSIQHPSKRMFSSLKNRVSELNKAVGLHLIPIHLTNRVITWSSTWESI